MYGSPIEQSGPFTITRWQGRNTLYLNDEKLAECVNGDYEERFGGLNGWLKAIVKRSTKRLNKIEEQKQELLDEEASLNDQLALIRTELGEAR